MNKPLSLVLVLSVLSVMGYAQTNNLDAEVDAELTQMYQTSKVTAQPTNGTVTIPNEGTATTNTTTTVTSQPIYVINPAVQSQVQAQTAVQTQPTTVIEASPLTESRADNLRKARQDAEMSTEAKIVEKLEQSRLEDEKRRAQVLFGDKLNGQATEAGPAPAPAAPAAQPQAPQIIIIPQQVAPAPAPTAPTEVGTVEVNTKVEKEVEEASVASEMSLPVEPLVHVPVSKRYFSGLIGVNEVDSAAVKSNYALGFSFGTKYDDTYSVEGTFLYSNSEVENVRNPYFYSPFGSQQQVNLFDMNQYTGSMALKYYLLSGMVKPVIGGIGQYSYREFQWSDKNGIQRSLSPSTSHAFDIGASAGVEIEFSPKMRMGFDVRYMKNIAVNRDYSTDVLRYNNGAPLSGQQIQDADFGYRTPIEELDSYSYTFAVTVNF